VTATRTKELQMSTASNRTYATGKRKTAIARVWLSPGSGQILVNERPADQYFERDSSVMIMKQALELIESLDQFDVWATVHGGGHAAQAEAMRHGISRALITMDPEKRSVLKRAGFLTRDARKKERKKYGQPGARKRFQYSKR
jgi:small subunit ribosomal protein S9